MSRTIDPSAPAGPRTPTPPRNPAPIPSRPAPPKPPSNPRPSRALTLGLCYAVLLAAFTVSPLMAFGVSYFLLVLLLSPQRHRPWQPTHPAPGLTGAAVLRGAAAPGDSLGRAASAATGSR